MGDEADFSWIETMYKFRVNSYSTDLLIDFSIGTDIKNSSWRVIDIDQASLGQAQTYLVKGLSDRTVSAYYKYMVNVAVLLGAERKSFPLAGVQFQTGGAEQLPHPDNSAQLVIAGRAIHYFKQADFFKEVDRVLCPGGVVAYYSVHFPTVLDEQVDKLWWEIMDSDQLAPYWPTNPGDGHTIGARNRRDYYVDVIKAPFAETRVDESVSYDRQVTLANLATELDTYSAAVRQREACGNEVADKMISDFLEKSLKALGTSDSGTPIKTRNSFFIVMTRKPI